MKTKHFVRWLFVIWSSLSFVNGHSINGTVKNVILLIGDGMGPQQVGLLETYAKHAPNSCYAGRPTAMSQLVNEGRVGLSWTSPEDKIVVDSACSANQLASGKPSRSEMIGLDYQGRGVKTVLDYAQQRGKKVGLVSDTRLTHATPAAFAAHTAHRSMEDEIAAQMVAKDIDVMLSAGLSRFLPSSINTNDTIKQYYKEKIGDHIPLVSDREDDLDLLKVAESEGYTTVFDRHAMQQAQGSVLGLFASRELKAGIDHKKSVQQRERLEPTLAEMTETALDLLSKGDKGFFLMVEGGQIDWAGHQNDAGQMLHELLKFDEAIQVVVEWAKNRNDTAILLTADHETGGFGFSYSGANLPKSQRIDTEAFSKQDFKPQFNFADFDILDALYNQKLSFNHIIEAYDALEEKERTVEMLQKMIQENTGFKLSLEEVAPILEQEINQYHEKSHPYLKAFVVPKVNDFSCFYIYGNKIRANLIARSLAKYHNIVWGTATHTATPVMVAATGPKRLINQVKGFQKHTDLGNLLIDWVGGR